MDAFENSYLRCDMEIGLIPGPALLEEPFYSVDLQVLEEYPAKDVAQTLSHLDGVTLIARADVAQADDWYAWKWRWQQTDRTIAIDFTTFYEPAEPAIWGGSQLKINCTFADLMLLWRAFQAHFPASYLHDEDCRMFSPHSFLAVYAIPRLRPALTHPDVVVQVRAERELAVYRELGYRGDPFVDEE